MRDMSMFNCWRWEEKKKIMRIIGRLKLLKQNESLGYRAYFFSCNKDAWGGRSVWIFGDKKLMVLLSDNFHFLCEVEGKTICWDMGQYETVFKTVEEG